ncbi:MAG: DUF1569 domain-containing protein [Ginsengibacter sp.]
MTLNISQQHGNDDIIARVKNLQTSAEKKWGSMNVVEMLVHCNNANKIVLNSPASSRGDSLKQNLFKMIFLHLKFSFPKNIKAPKPLAKMVDGISIEDFEQHKTEYVEIMKKFLNFEFPKKMYHPAFGNLNPKEWGVATWMHMDHHLRQFSA